MLIFSMGSYLRFKNVVLVTDSAYGILDGMMYIALQGIHWVSGVPFSQKRGFLDIKDFQNAAEKVKSLKPKKPKEPKGEESTIPKRSHADEV